MTEKVTKLALASRLIVLILQLLANMALPDHKPDVFRSVVEPKEADLSAPNNVSSTTKWFDNTLQYCLGGLRHWDGEYFLHIAEHGYSYENTLAFFPLYPMLVRSSAQVIHHYLGLGLTLRTWCLLLAVLLNLFCFCRAANTLYTLTQYIFNDLNKSWNAALLFCFNPASIFFTAAYSETLFCWLSLHLMLECIGQLRFLRCVGMLALCIVSRSNGLVNAGFPAYFMLRRCLLQRSRHLLMLAKLLISFLLALLPLTFFYFYAFQQFCQQPQVQQEEQGPQYTSLSLSPAVLAYGGARGYVLAGKRQLHTNSPWCDDTLPFPYSYIQSHYWHVGFLRYYKLKQLPNFLLALPVLSFLYWHCGKYLRHAVRVLLPKYTLLQLLKEYKSFPFVLHALFLTIFCTLFVHIQISTRLLCSATPCFYWFAADHLPKTLYNLRLRSKAGFILLWFGSYFLVGTVLFSNNLPWT